MEITPVEDRAQMEGHAGARLALILASHRRFAGSDLARDPADLWQLPQAVLAHDSAPRPRFFYANRAALGLFRMRVADLAGMVSALSAPPVHRAERAAMLARLEVGNLVPDYTGIRIAMDGSRWRISGARLWNLVDGAGVRQGQAVLIGCWEPEASAPPI